MKTIMKEQDKPGAKHAAGGFGSLTSDISTKWKTIDSVLKLELEAMANLDRDTYVREIEAWKASKDAAEAALIVGSARDNTVEVPLREVVFDSEQLREMSSQEMSPLGFVYSLDLYSGQPTAYDFPRMPFEPPQYLSSKNAAAADDGDIPFVCNNGTGTNLMHCVTQPARTNLQVASQVQASNIRFDPMPSFRGFQGGIRGPCFSFSGSGRRVSCPEVSAAKNGTKDDSSQEMSDEEQDPNYMKGYIQGFNEKMYGSSKSSNGPDVNIVTFTSDSFKPMIDGGLAQKPSFVQGYIKGFKAASGMCDMFNQG
jgi:hypothetical protein